MSALGGGKRYKTPYVEMINRQKGYLPALYAQKKQDKYQKESQALDERRLKNEEEMAHEIRKKQRLAQNLGYANVGLNALFGANEAGLFDSVGDWFGGGETDTSFMDFHAPDVYNAATDVFGDGDLFGGGLFEDIADTFMGIIP
jgi:hypothetical protein